MHESSPDPGERQKRRGLRCNSWLQGVMCGSAAQPISVKTTCALICLARCRGGSGISSSLASLSRSADAETKAAALGLAGALDLASS